MNGHNNTQVTMLAPRVLSELRPALETWIAERVPPQIPGWVPTAQLALSFPGYPPGTPGYPDEPFKDTRQNLHLPAGERRELRAVADGMKLDASILFRKIWRAYMATPEAQEALQRYLRKQGTYEDTPDKGE